MQESHEEIDEASGFTPKGPFKNICVDDLNDYCFFNIFDSLSIDKLVNLSRVSQRWNNLSKDYFLQKTELTLNNDDMNMLFSDYELDIDKKKVFVNLMNKYSKSLKRVRILFFYDRDFYKGECHIIINELLIIIETLSQKFRNIVEFEFEVKGSLFNFNTMQMKRYHAALNTLLINNIKLENLKLLGVHTQFNECLKSVQSLSHLRKLTFFVNLCLNARNYRG